MQTGIALGSNLGDRQKNLDRAFAFLSDLSLDRQILRSRVIETEPVDCPPGSESFLNAVAEIDYEGGAEQLHAALRQFETSMGRTTDGVKNAPRAIDLDILYFGNQRLDQAGLVIPHPRLIERRFVLEPLAEIRPELILPGQMEPVAALLLNLVKSEPTTAVSPA